jgi:hypothetical protein
MSRLAPYTRRVTTTSPEGVLGFHAADFRARGSQNGEFKRPRRDTFAHAQLTHERSDLGPRQCGIVRASGNRAGRR